MMSKEIRRKFLQYFKERGHSVIASSPVLPHEDPTLLFNNAGMNQFKDLFLGKSVRDYKRATSSQKCIRAGGKHNDLENVGHTSRHLTFFEMLGNFSFGDYFKKEAIRYSWEVATEVFGLDPKKIWPTVYKDDDEAFALWTAYVPAERITRFGDKENFWAMGETGPCGPCSELLYDRGPSYGDAKNPKEDPDGERYLEFWNLVFMQYNRTADGFLEPLPSPSIDTGAGLERIVALKMGVDNVFETDVLRSLIFQIEAISGCRYYPENPEQAPAFRVIADHLRTLAFAIADGVQPSNVDRGYVLRKILRRAVRYGRMLEMDEPFLGRVLPALIKEMGEDYPELVKAQSRIAEVLTNEEEAFLRTLRRGGNLLGQIIENAKLHSGTITGEDAFKLKDTYGFPIEEILLVAIDAGLKVDLPRYQELEKEAKDRSRSLQKTTQQVATGNLFAGYLLEQGMTRFIGHTQTMANGKVTAILVDSNFVNEMTPGQEGMVLLDQTPFYAEMGGQVGDIGTLSSAKANFRVTDCQAPFKGIIAHLGRLETGSLKIGDTVTAKIDQQRRHKIANNHTATHLMHWALHQVLGEHVKQAGSVVDPERLRFDFSHHKVVTPAEIKQIEDLVNDKIRENAPVKIYELAYEEAQRRGEIKQFFGEKYDSVVRVVDINFSKELCGGIHARATGDIGYFRIAKESSIAAGTRRIEAVTGKEAELIVQQTDQLLANLANNLKAQVSQLPERIEKLLQENKQLGQELKQAKKRQLGDLVQSLIAQAEKINGMQVLVAEVILSPEEMKTCAEEIIAKLHSCAIVLGTALADKGHLVARVSDDMVHKGVKADLLIKAVSPIIEGSGGGKPNQAQAGGKAPQKLLQALTEAKALIAKALS